MKGRDTGMPEEDDWASFFDAACIVEKLIFAEGEVEDVADLGCGYGTFTLPVARRAQGIVYAFDIEPQLVARVRRKAHEAALTNLRAEVRDILERGTGLPSRTVDHTMIYNLLHVKEPYRCLDEAYRILRPGGTLSILHWIHDPATPRGPALSIRPRPEQCRTWAEAAGFVFVGQPDLSDCCAYHYGLLLRRPTSVRRV